MHQPPASHKVEAETFKWSSPDHNKEISVEHNGLYGSVIPSNGMFEWSVDGSLDGDNIDAGTSKTLDDAKKEVETILKEHKGQSKCRSCGKITDDSGLCNRCYNAEAATAKTKKVEAPAVSFTESELDSLLSYEAVDQEVKKMISKGVAPSQRMETKLIVADVTDAVRWQQTKEDELQKLKTSDTSGEMPWVQDLSEDFITYGLSPSNTKDEAKVILENLDKELETHADAGFGPNARNFITMLRKELEILLEKL